MAELTDEEIVTIAAALDLPDIGCSMFRHPTTGEVSVEWSETAVVQFGRAVIAASRDPD